jgi:hypothetical protein
VIGELDAIRLALVSGGWPTFYVEAPEHPDVFPYLVLGSSSGRMVAPALCADLSDLDDLVRVMAVGLTPESVVVTQEGVRAALHNTHPAVYGRSVTVRLFGSEPVAVDRDMTVAPTNRHPAYGVDLYRLTSVPTPPPPPVPPHIVAITPTSGPSTGGTAVTLTGTGFTGADLVAIGGEPVANLVVVNDTTVTGTTAPNYPGLKYVTLQNPVGTSILWDSFTYL